MGNLNVARAATATELLLKETSERLQGVVSILHVIRLHLEGMEDPSTAGMLYVLADVIDGEADALHKALLDGQQAVA